VQKSSLIQMNNRELTTCRKAACYLLVTENRQLAENQLDNYELQRTDNLQKSSLLLISDREQTTCRKAAC
jgi:hypothetical protein